MSSHLQPPQQQRRLPLSRVAVQRLEQSRTASARQRRRPGMVRAAVLLLVFGLLVVIAYAATQKMARPNNPLGESDTPRTPQTHTDSSGDQRRNVVRAAANEEDLSAVLPYQPHNQKLVVTREKSESSSSSSFATTSTKTKTRTAAAATISTNPWLNLPEWMRKYLEWHRYMRHIYPDTALWENPSAPGILLLYCSPPNNTRSALNSNGNCLESTAWTLQETVYAAAQTNRVLLLQWYNNENNSNLESLLKPAEMNWTVPDTEQLDYKHIAIAMADVHDTNGQKKAKKWGSHISTPLLHRWTTVDQNKQGTMRNTKEAPDYAKKDPWTEYKVLLLSTDDPEITRERSLLLGTLWKALFQPSPMVQQILERTQAALQLQPGHYSAVNVRVREQQQQQPQPQFTKGGGINKPVKVTVTAVSSFVGLEKERAVSMALHAVQCSRWLTRHDHNLLHTKDQHEPILLISNSRDLVEYMTNDVSKVNGPFNKNQSTLQNDLDAQLVAFQSMDGTGRLVSGIVVDDASSSRIVSSAATRPVSNRQTRNGNDEAVSSSPLRTTVVDFYLMMDARCVTFDSNTNLAYLASLISGSTCNIRHQDFKINEKKRNNEKSMIHQQIGKTSLCPI